MINFLCSYLEDSTKRLFDEKWALSDSGLDYSTLDLIRLESSMGGLGGPTFYVKAGSDLGHRMVPIKFKLRPGLNYGPSFILGPIMG